MQKIDKELDARGMVCPLPILRTKQSLAGMTSGQTLKIVATDPGSVIDFQVFAEQTGMNYYRCLKLTRSLFFLKKK